MTTEAPTRRKSKEVKAKPLTFRYTAMAAGGRSAKGTVKALSEVAAQNLLHTDTPVGRLRGRVHSLPGTGIPVVVTYHPAYLLRSPQQKPKVWQDLVMARRVARGAGDGEIV